jgi:hypothetical protein
MRAVLEILHSPIRPEKCHDFKDSKPYAGAGGRNKGSIGTGK